MSMTDPVADFLTRLRNAAHASHETVEMPSSKLKREMARILQEQGYIDGWETEEPSAEHVGELIRIKLKYTEARQPVIAGLKRVSRPGRRTYVRHDEIPRVQGGMGTTIVSTSHGVMTGHDAKRAGVGGELVAQVW
jgi:small subunit ribosomal protein S8